MLFCWGIFVNNESTFNVDGGSVMTRLQDDFYEYVNGKWAETAVIPDDKPSTTGGFMDLDRDIENLMLKRPDHRKMARREELPR